MKYNSLNIQNIFIKSFAKYINEGYTKVITEINLDTSQNLDSIRIQLKNDKIDREFSFRFQVYNGYDKAFIAEFVWFSMDKENSNNRLKLNDYWRRVKGDEKHIPASLTYQDNEDTFEERLKNYFEIVIDTLENDLKTVVEGKEWIDLPFDFYPYK